MPTLLAGWALMLAALYALVQATAPASAMPWWALLAGVACALGALLIKRQPIGQATGLGRFGSSIVHWGWRAGQGRLWPPVLISWLVWLLVGTAIIAGFQHRGDTSQQLLILAWAVDVGAVFYLVGLGLARRGLPGSLLVIIGALIVMLGSSAFLASKASPALSRFALIVAGGPPLVLGLGYGAFFLAMLTVGRKARWN